MEHQHQASTAIIALASRPIEGHISTDSASGQPGERIILDEETYIIEADGGIIPVPAGTVATLLPDSDDEVVEENQPMSDSFQPTSMNSVVAVDVKSNTSCLSASEAQETSSVVAFTASVANEEKYDVILSEVDSCESLPTDHVTETSSCEKLDDAVVKEESSSAVSATEEMPQCEPERTDFQSDSGVEELSPVIAICKSVPAVSDLYVQEEEEVVMDEAVNCESQEIQVVHGDTDLLDKSGTDDDSSDNRISKSANKKTSKVESIQNEETCEINETASAKSPHNDTPSDFAPAVSEKKQKSRTVSTPLALTSASGRPQRNTPRRSAIDLLKGSDAKPARRPAAAAESESEQPVSKHSKTVLPKKSVEANSSSPAQEEKASTNLQSRGRGRRKVSETSTVPTSGNLPQQKVDNSTEEKNVLEIIGAPSQEFVQNGELKSPSDGDSQNIEVDLNIKEDKEADITTKRESLREIRNVPTRNAKKKVIADKSDDFHPSDNCETAKANGDHNQHGEKTDDTGNDGKNYDVVPASSTRGRRRKVTVDIAQDQKNSNQHQQRSDQVSSKQGGGTGDGRQLASFKEREFSASDSGSESDDNANSSALCPEADTDRFLETSGLPGLPYHAFTTDQGDKSTAEVKLRTKNVKVRQRKDKLESQVAVGRENSKYILGVGGVKLSSIESMQARIRELEAEVERLQDSLHELTGKSNETSIVSQRKTSFKPIQKEDSPRDLSTDERSELDRWEKKLRELDRELDEKRSALIIQVGCITRYERQVLEKERRLKRLEISLNARKQQVAHGHADDASKDVLPIKDVPMLMAGRVDLQAEEQKLELRRQELERQRNFLEDEKKKLVAKERELETREQAAVDADLFSIASVYKTTDIALSVSSAVKQSNGKIDVDFSDDEDEFGTAANQFDGTFTSALSPQTPDAEHDDDKTSIQDEIPFSKVSTSASKSHKRSTDEEDGDVEKAAIVSNTVSAKLPSKRRRVENDVDRNKTRNKRAA